MRPQHCLRAFPISLAISMATASALGASRTSTTTSSTAAPISAVEEAPVGAKPVPAPVSEKAPSSGPQLGGGLSLGIEAAYRPRFSADTGRDLVDGRHKAFVNHRARVGLVLAHENGLRVVARLQDVRTWGEEEPSPLGSFDANGFDLHEAFASIPLLEGLAVQVGRQEISWDNDRLLGNVDWTQRAQAFDALRLLAKSQAYGISSELFLAKVREADVEPDGHVPAGRRFDIDLGGFRVAYDRSPRYRLAGLYLFNGNYGQREQRHTVGLNVAGALAELRYSAEAYLQHGALTQGGVDQSALAYLVAGSLGYALVEAPWQPTLTLIADLVSGDGTRAGAFDTLYATNHKFYGEMDFFLNLPLQTANLGLADLGAKLAAAPSTWMKVGVDIHHLRGMKKSPSGAAVFGHEVDFRCSLAPMEHLSINAFYGVLLPDDLMAVRFPALPAGNELRTEHFVYLTTEIKL